MSDQTDRLTSLLEPFGLSRDEAQIYLILTEKGSLSALDISRELHMGRTKVYRILDKVIAKHVVTQQYSERGFTFAAAEPSRLELLVIEKQKQAESLTTALPMVTRQLAQLAMRAQTGARVLYYTGARGLEQVTYNSLAADKELLIYEVKQDMSAFVDKKTAEAFRQQYVERRIVTRQLTNQRQIAAYTDVTAYVQRCWQVKWIDPVLLAIDFEVLIYNDVYALYAVDGGELYCVEIHDARLAAMQKQIFEFVWNEARGMKIGPTGEASLG